MNKFFISGLRKEANPAVVGLALGGHKFKPSLAQAADYSNPGQPSWWEKPLYALQRAVPYSFAKPTSQKMFDPKDNPKQYMNELQQLAAERMQRLTARSRAANDSALKAEQAFKDYMKQPYAMGDNTYWNMKKYVGDLIAKSDSLYEQRKRAEQGYNHIRPGIAADAYMHSQGWNK
jgi:hypothetical protein